MKLQFDVTIQEFGIIEEILANNLTNNCQVWVFGSRAKNSALFNSDLDLALECNHKIASKVLIQLRTDFEKSKLPYRVDVLNIGTVEAYFQEIINKKKILFPFKAKNKVPLLRFSEFSGEWDSKLFIDIIDVIDGDRGANYPKSNDFFNKEYCLFLSAKNVTKNGFVFNDTQFIKKERDELLRKGKLNRYDVVLTTRGTVGQVAFYSDVVLYNNIRINSGMVLLRNSSNNLLSNYFFKACNSFEIAKQIKIATFGSAQPQLTVKEINKIKINLPTKPEQQKIETFLTAVDTKIEQLSKKQALLSAYKKGVMQKIFSQTIRVKADDGSEFPEWGESKLGDVGIFYRGHSYNSINVKDDGLLVLRSSNIKNGLLVLDKNLQFVDKDCSDNISLRKNDIVICMANGSKNLVGKSGVYHGDYNNKLTVGAFCSIFRTDNLLSKYILQTVQYKKYLHVLLAGTNINNLKNSELAELKFNLPYSIEEQTKIANFLSSIDTKIKQMNKQLDKSKEFKKALLQQMFV